MKTINASDMKDKFFEKANDAIDAGIFWRGNLARAVRQKDFKGSLLGISALSFVLFLYVWQHMEVVKLSYDVQALEQQKKQLTNEYYYLKFQMNGVNNLARVEEIARNQLGMETPNPDQVIIMEDDSSSVPRWLNFWKKIASAGSGK